MTGCFFSKDSEVVNQFLFGLAGHDEFGKMSASFKAMDLDGNSKLSMAEVYARMQAMELKVSLSTAIEIFSRFE